MQWGSCRVHVEGDGCLACLGLLPGPSAMHTKTLFCNGSRCHRIPGLDDSDFLGHANQGDWPPYGGPDFGVPWGVPPECCPPTLTPAPRSPFALWPFPSSTLQSSFPCHECQCGKAGSCSGCWGTQRCCTAFRRDAQPSQRPLQGHTRTLPPPPPWLHF